jgi:hypothetical protein
MPRPTHIHLFSLKHSLIVAQPHDSCRRFLLAFETDLGKLFAYLLPTAPAREGRLPLLEWRAHSCDGPE